MFPECSVAVEACSKHFFRGGHPYGKSPCFSDVAFLSAKNADALVSTLRLLNMGGFHG